MYDQIRGIVSEVNNCMCLLEVNSGWTYKILIPSRYHGDNLISRKSTQVFYVVVLKRDIEDIMYGFLLRQEQEMFTLIYKVHGIGPKLALQVLSQMSVCNLHHAVLTNDILFIKKVPGIGDKIAKRMLLELQPKFSGSMHNQLYNEQNYPDVHQAEIKEDGSGYIMAYNAMLQLGYSAKVAKVSIRRVLSGLYNINIDNTEALVSASIKEATKAITSTK